MLPVFTDCRFGIGICPSFPARRRCLRSMRGFLLRQTIRSILLFFSDTRKTNDLLLMFYGRSPCFRGVSSRQEKQLTLQVCASYRAALAENVRWTVASYHRDGDGLVQTSAETALIHRSPDGLLAA
jgi:hypothetical protein